MLEGLRTAAAGMQAQQQKLNSVANDLANANTNGYKRLRVGFADLLYEQGGRPTVSNDAQLGTGTRAIQAGRTFEQGALKDTGVMTDVAPRGPGLHEGQALRRPRRPDARRRPAHRRQPPPGHQLRRHRPAGDHDPAGSRGRRSRSRPTAPCAPRARTSARSSSSTSARRTTSSRSATTPSSPPPRSGATRRRAGRDAAQAGRARGLEHRHGPGHDGHDRGPAQLQMTSKAIQTADQMMEIANGVKR